MTKTLARLGALLLVAAASMTALPAQAAPAASHISATASPAVTQTHSTVVVTGSASPAGALGAVNLQLDKNGSWVTVGHFFSKGGAFTLKYVTPGAPTDVVLRVSRGAQKTYAAAVSKTLRVHVVKQAFAVTATPGNTTLGPGQKYVVSGTVTPSVSGKVFLQQRLADGTWSIVGGTTLKKGHFFTVATTAIKGTFSYRVLRPYTKAVAQGVSRTFSLKVDGPEVTTTGLTAVVGQPFQGALTSTGGVGVIDWDIDASPPGLDFLSAGAFFGRPTTVGSTTLTATARDSEGHLGQRTITFVVTPVSVRSWGNNVVGQLGSGSAGRPVASPAATLAQHDVRTVSAGDSFTLALTADGHVWSWGDNTNGQLGTGTVGGSSATPAITSLSHVVSIAAGAEAGYAVKDDGTVWAWGASNNGELGLAGTAPTGNPAQVAGISTAKQVSAGGEYAIVLLTNGTVDAFGSGHFGTLGNGTSPDAQPTPVAVSGFGQFQDSPATSISAGRYDAYALRADGSVYAWGANVSGSLGQGTPGSGALQTTPVVVAHLNIVSQLDCHGTNFCLAVEYDGTVWSWGQDNDGQLGYSTPSGEADYPAQVPGLSKIAKVAAGASSSYALAADGTVQSWGLNREGQLGNGTTTAATGPAAIPGLTGVVDLSAGLLTAFALTSP